MHERLDLAGRDEHERIQDDADRTNRCSQHDGLKAAARDASCNRLIGGRLKRCAAQSGHPPGLDNTDDKHCEQKHAYDYQRRRGVIPRSGDQQQRSGKQTAEQSYRRYAAESAAEVPEEGDTRGWFKSGGGAACHHNERHKPAQPDCAAQSQDGNGDTMDSCGQIEGHASKDRCSENQTVPVMIKSEQPAHTRRRAGSCGSRPSGRPRRR